MASVSRTSPHVSQNVSDACSVPKMQTNPSIDFSGANYGAFVSLHWLSFPPSLKPQPLKRWQYRWRMGNMRDAAGRATHLAQRRECKGPCASTKTVELATAEEAAMGEYFGVVLLPKKIFQTGPGASQFIFQERQGWTFPFSPLHSSDAGRTCVLWFSRSSSSE